MKRFILSMSLAVLSSSALYVVLMSNDGFDSAYWLGVSIYSSIWILIIGVPALLVLKKHKKLGVIPLSIIGASCTALSISLPHFKDVYLAKTSSLTLQQGKDVLFENGIMTEFALNQFYESLLFGVICGVVGGAIFSLLINKRNDSDRGGMSTTAKTTE